MYEARSFQFHQFGWYNNNTKSNTSDSKATLDQINDTAESYNHHNHTDIEQAVLLQDHLKGKEIMHSNFSIEWCWKIGKWVIII